MANIYKNITDVDIQLFIYTKIYITDVDIWLFIIIIFKVEVIIKIMNEEINYYCIHIVY